MAFVDSPESLELKTFLKVAEKLRAQNFHLPFYHSYNSSIFPQFGSPISPPLVRIYHKFESKFTDIKVGLLVGEFKGEIWMFQG